MSFMAEINGVSFQPAYFAVNLKGRFTDSAGIYEVRDPPTSGWSRCFVIQPDESGRKAKRLTVFCPYTLFAYTVTPKAREVAGLQPMDLTDKLVAKLTAIITKNWEAFSRYGLQRDYDVAALVLTRLGKPVPTYVSAKAEALEYDEDFVPNRHGKAVGEKLFKPVLRSTRRGEVLAFFMEDGQKSIREAMAKFDMSRSGVLTHLHGLNKEHGLGYVLTGDVASIMLPPGCTEPLADETQVQAVTSSTKSGKPCKEIVTDLPAKGKRREVALMMLQEQALEDVAAALDCSVSSVRSHLHDLHAKHGFGFEMSPDRARGRLLVPAGWVSPQSVEDLDPLA